MGRTLAGGRTAAAALRLEGLLAAAADRFEALRGRWDTDGGVLEYDYDTSDQLGPFP